MANSAYRFSLASYIVAGMAKILQTLESKEHALKAGELAKIAQRDPATHLQNGFIEHPQK